MIKRIEIADADAASIGVFLASVGEGLRQDGIAPDNDGDAQLIKALRMEIDQHRKLRQMALTELLSTRRERDMLANHSREQSDRVLRLMQSKLSAEDAVAAIMARADEDGAMHRDAMIAVLRSMGAR